MSIIFNGINSDDLGVFVERYPARRVASRKRQTIEIPGRNGLLTMAEEAYDNVTQRYDVYLRAPDGLDDALEAVLAWLETPGGYAELRDSYDTEHYRMAMFIGGDEVESCFNQFGRATLEFSCLPQRFTLAGQNQTTWTANFKIINNDTSYQAKPLIRVHGAGDITLTVGGSTIAISGLTTQRDIYIDSETEDCYNGATNMGDMVTVSGGYPILRPGDNIIQRTGGGSEASVAITPRWWVL